MTKKTGSTTLKAPIRQITAAVNRNRDEAIRIAREIGELAEPPLHEFRSAGILEEYLTNHGFRVTRPWRILPTAFRASIGSGRPTIGLLAEYDALPDCGRRRGAWGHGCGHNLLGTASALAGVVAARLLHNKGRSGRIIVFGTPAEETLAGKVYMAREGAFRRLDAVLAWHPSSETRADIAGGAAMDSLSFVFRGTTAHAGGAPHKGRSALDAAMLTDVAVNYLREHVQEMVRIHCVIPEGGSAPNVVPDRAEIWYYVRGRSRGQVDAVRKRVQLCARGAAMATETRCRMIVHDSVTERVRNRTLGDLMDCLLRRVGAPKFTAADTRSARKVIRGCEYATKIEPIKSEPGRGSSDEDNVSWFAPLGRVSVACVPKGTVSHHRHYAEMVATPGGYRGMLKAAEVMAAGAVELAVNARLLGKAKLEFKKQMVGRKYKLPMSPNARPPAYKVD